MSTFPFRNKDLVLARELRSSFKKVYGIGFSTIFWFTTKMGLAFPLSSSILNSYYLSNLLGFLNATLRSETKMLRAVEVRIKLLTDLNHWRGRRHALFLPTRGQRSRTNARTKKSLRFHKIESN